MNTRDFINSKERPRVVSIFTGIFAFLYHLSFLFVFYILEVKPMFYFNIGSVILFAIISVLAFKTRNYIALYLSSSIEVLAHQILADYFLGAHSSFHFFLIVISILPYLLFPEKIKMAIFSSLLPLIIFVIIEILNVTLLPVYLLDIREITIIKAVNISFSMLVMASSLFLFSFIVSMVENHLEEEVEHQTEKLQKQNQKIIDIQKNTIFSLSNLVENRDSDTGEHIHRTSEYVQLLAKAARKKGYCASIITDNYIDLLYRAAPMHDIGKIVVSDLVLKKPGKLTDEEFLEIQRHAKEGGRIIREVLVDSDDADYIKTASEIATCHHEKWNGSGYPNKIKGEEIPLSARIMAIADVFDALVSKRCYKAAMTPDEAFKIIEESSGTHFDPALVEIFLENKNQILEILNKYKE